MQEFCFRIKGSSFSCDRFNPAPRIINGYEAEQIVITMRCRSQRTIIYSKICTYRPVVCDLCAKYTPKNLMFYKIFPNTTHAGGIHVERQCFQILCDKEFFAQHATETVHAQKSSLRLGRFQVVLFVRQPSERAISDGF